jgi:hypothetical protein
MDIDAEEWLAEWVAGNVQTAQFMALGDMEIEAEQCLQAAAADGLEKGALFKAAGGNLEAYLVRQQNVFTVAQIKRKTEED